MKWVICFFVFLFFSIGCVSAANYYVRPNGGNYGLEDGSSWSNAFDGFSDISWNSVSCGDTIWVSGGTYTQSLIPGKSGCTSGSRLYIRRARSDSSVCTSSSGWSSSFDSTVHQVRSGIYISGNNDYITFSGRTTSSGGSHGWYIDFTTATSGPGIEFYNGADGDYNIFEYLDIQGPGSIVYTNDGRGIDATPFSGASDNTFSHLKIWDWESGIYNAGMDRSVFEYIEMFNMDAVNWNCAQYNPCFHPNGIYLVDAVGGVVRYSKFYRQQGGVGEGIFFEQGGGCSNWKIYGNVFYNLDQAGLKAIEITSTVSDVKIFNNVFDSVSVSPGEYGGSCTGSSEYRNNLFYAASPGSCGSSSNNLVASSASVFVNRAAHDYHIVSTTGSSYPRNAGTALASEYNIDPDGNVRGSDGAWDIGAYEYSSSIGGDTTSPTATITSPTSSSTYSTTSSAINLGGTASDNVGVTSVTWSNSLGGSGTASGISSWSISGISLQPGVNVITITARDAAGNTANDVLSVTYSVSTCVNCHYVRDGASGDGSSWSSGWGELSNVNWGTIGEGGTLYIAAGSYTTSFSSINVADVTVKRATIGDHGTNTGWSDLYDGQVTIDPSGNFLVIGSSADGLVLDGASNNPWKFRVVGVSGYNGMLRNDGADDVIIRNIEFDGNGENPSETNGPEDGLRWMGGRNDVIEYCYIHDYRQVGDEHMDGVQGPSCTDITFRYNIFKNNGMDLFLGDCEWGSQYCNGITIHHNLFYNDQNGGSYNTIVFKGTNSGINKIENNVFNIRDQGTVFYLASGCNSVSNSYFRNNIIYDSSPGDINSYSHSYNIYYNSGSSSETGGLTSDPLFTSVSNNDYSLQLGSPAIDSGTSLGYTSDILGNAISGVPDRGAYEHDSSGAPVVACSSDIQCDDGNSCTTDTCLNPGATSSSCQYSNNANSCNDNNVCTTGDVCSFGSCSGTLITSCSLSSDGCCPSGCTDSNDADCSALPLICGSECLGCSNRVLSTACALSAQCDGTNIVNNISLSSTTVNAGNSLTVTVDYGCWPGDNLALWYYNGASWALVQSWASLSGCDGDSDGEDGSVSVSFVPDSVQGTHYVRAIEASSGDSSAGSCPSIPWGDIDDMAFSVVTQGCVPVHEADNQICGDGISLDEITAYFDLWLSGEKTINDLLVAVGIWKG